MPFPSFLLVPRAKLGWVERETASCLGDADVNDPALTHTAAMTMAIRRLDLGSKDDDDEKKNI